MYGLVNRAIADLLIQQYGEDAWSAIKDRAGVDIDVFIRMEAYPDEISYRLIEAASEHLQVPQQQLLEAFGRYWTRYTGDEGYGELMEAAGEDLWEFLHNLDELHSRVGLIYPNLTPPSFSCSDQQPGSLVLHYYSKRQGLAPMVVGLVEGLALRFQEKVTIERQLHSERGDDHDSFLIARVR